MLVVIVFPTPAAKKMNVREFRLIVLHLKVSGIILSCAGKPSKFNGIYIYIYILGIRTRFSET